MAKKRKSEVKLDFSSFMPILILTIGCLVVLLVTNTIIIVSNPENVRISSIIKSSMYVEGGSGIEGGAPFPHGNKEKEPTYVDVHRDKLIVYSVETPSGSIVPVRDLEIPGNAFEELVRFVEGRQDHLYIVLLVRPRAATIARRVRKVIRDRGIDLGYELFEDGRPIDYEAVQRAVTS